MAESTGTTEVAEAPAVETAEDAGEHVSEYTTETTAESGERQPARKPVVTGSALGTGRRKEAIARVRIVPGSGQWRINDRTLAEFFPNKVHQQLISEPFVSLGAENQFDVVARISGGGITGQAGALRLGIARALILVDPDNRRHAEAGRLPDPGRAGQGAQEVRSEEGTQGASVLQALKSADLRSWPTLQAILFGVPRRRDDRGATRSWRACSEPTVSVGWPGRI